MKIITNLKQLTEKFRKPVVAIGIFDGVHLGHKKVLKMAAEKARRLSGTSIVVTFDPHPQRVLDTIGAPPLLVSTKHRLNLISKEGMDVACVLNFNEAVAGHAASEFVKKTLVKKLGAHTIVIGSDFRFGRSKKGDINLLRRLGKEFNFTVIGVPLLKIGPGPVSSTRIRALIMSGKLKEASGLLGRPVSILGTVVKGNRRGRLLGYPTANINPHHEAIPPSGVYAVYAMFEGRKYKGILNIGRRPTFLNDGAEPTIETHIFGFGKSIYGKDIEVIFVKRLREEKRFPGKKELVKQIRIDERRAFVVL